MSNNNRIAATLFPTDIVCLRNININTLHKGDDDDGDGDDDDDDDNNNNNNNNNNNAGVFVYSTPRKTCEVIVQKFQGAVCFI